MTGADATVYVWLIVYIYLDQKPDKDRCICSNCFRLGSFPEIQFIFGTVYMVICPWASISSFSFNVLNLLTQVCPSFTTIFMGKEKNLGTFLMNHLMCNLGVQNLNEPFYVQFRCVSFATALRTVVEATAYHTPHLGRILPYLL